MASKATQRPKRQAARNKIYTEDRVLKCNPSLYVGYVEDLETPEMIMKKFEALESFKAEQDERRRAEKENAERAKAQMEMQNGYGDEYEEEQVSSKKKKVSRLEEDEVQMSEEQLEEIFRRTSAFSALSLVLPPEARSLRSIDRNVTDFGDYYEDDGWDMGHIIEEEGVNGERYFLFSDDDSLYGERRPRRSRSSKTTTEKVVRHRRQRIPSGNRAAQQEEGNEMHPPNLQRARQTLLKSARLRRRRPNDPNAVAFVRIPNDPVPSSWAKKILQYVPEDCIHVHTHWTSQDVLMPRPVSFKNTPAPCTSRFNFTNLGELAERAMQTARESGGFNGVVLNPHWREPRPGAPIYEGGIVPEDLAKLPLGSKEFLPAGFVYIWTPKHWLHRTLQILETLDLHYVENAVVVNEIVGDGQPLSQQCEYFAQQKETLLVCRRGRMLAPGKLIWEGIELRHQRISDVHVACFKPSRLRPDIPQKPFAYVHKMVETMLPVSRYCIDRPDHKPRFCEMWSECASRSGWVFLEKGQ